MENLTTFPEQAKNNQASNEQIPNRQPRKTWVEPQLVRFGVETGNIPWFTEFDIHTQS